MRIPIRLPAYSTHKLLIPLAVSTGTMVNGSTYYFTYWNVAWDATETNYPMYALLNGRIRGINLSWAYGNAPTQENCSLYIRVQGVDTLLTTTLQLLATPPTNYSNLLINAPFKVGDKISVKMVCPTWATPPTSARVGGGLIIEFD